jgi:uncharacterized membrane protein YdjX (TVP38/TMEM64 family)
MRVFLLVFVIGITVALFYYRDEVQKLSQLGYWGIFLISILTNATLVLPLPGVVFTSAMGAIFNPFWVAVASGSGATLGEITGYLAGYSGQVIVDRREWYERLTVWMRKYGNITIFLMALIPNPMFDLAGMAAGMLRMPLARFFLWCFLGKLLKMIVFAYTGLSIFKMFMD